MDVTLTSTARLHIAIETTLSSEYQCASKQKLLRTECEKKPACKFTRSQSDKASVGCAGTNLIHGDPTPKHRLPTSYSLGNPREKAPTQALFPCCKMSELFWQQEMDWHSLGRFVHGVHSTGFISFKGTTFISKIMTSDNLHTYVWRIHFIVGNLCGCLQ